MEWLRFLKEQVKIAEDKSLTLLTKIDLIEELAEKLDLLDLSKTIRP